MTVFQIKFSDELRRAIRKLADEGVRYREIGKQFGLSRGQVNGIVWRERNNVRSKPRVAIGTPAMGAYHNYRDIKPAKAPFAPDDSCPDFANDEDHLTAVLSQRPNGFPVAERRAA